MFAIGGLPPTSDAIAGVASSSEAAAAPVISLPALLVNDAAGDDSTGDGGRCRRRAVPGLANLQAILLVNAVDHVADVVVAEELGGGLIEPIPELIVVGTQADGVRCSCRL